MIRFHSISIGLAGLLAACAGGTQLTGSLEVADGTDAARQGMVSIVSVDLRTADRAAPVLIQQRYANLTANRGVDYSFDLPDSLDDSRYYSPGGNWNDAEIATFMLGAFEDSDNTQTISPGDMPVAGSAVVLAHVRGPNRDLPDEGEGWYRFEYDPTSFEEGPSALTAMGNDPVLNLTTNLLPRQQEDLSGLVVPQLQEGDLRVDIVSLATNPVPTTPSLIGAILPSMDPNTVFDIGAPPPPPPPGHTPTFIAAPSGEPIANRWTYRVVAYLDREDDDVFSPGDVALADSLHAGDASRRVQYVAPTDMAAALTLIRLNVIPGWSLVGADLDENGVFPTQTWNDGVTLGDISD